MATPNHPSNYFFRQWLHVYLSSFVVHSSASSASPQAWLRGTSSVSGSISHPLPSPSPNVVCLCGDLFTLQRTAWTLRLLLYLQICCPSSHLVGDGALLSFSSQRVHQLFCPSSICNALFASPTVPVAASIDQQLRCSLVTACVGDASLYLFSRS